MRGREVKFGSQTLVRGRDFVRKRGAVLFVDRQGTMACLACGHRWVMPVSDQGFYAPPGGDVPAMRSGNEGRRWLSRFALADQDYGPLAAVIPVIRQRSSCRET